MHDIILPNPNDGSITLGVNFYYITFTIFCSKDTWSAVNLKLFPLTSIFIDLSVSNCCFNWTLRSYTAFYKWEIIAWESFLNYLPMTFLSKTIVVWS